MTTLTILGLGDILVDREAPGDALAAISPLISAASLTIANFEGVLSPDCTPLPGAGLATIVHPRNVQALRGIDVISLANNHSLDGGYNALELSRDILRKAGIHPIGAGRNSGEAWTPLILPVRDGHRIGIVAFSSVFPKGWSATSHRAGIAGLLSRDFVTPKHPDDLCPGVLPVVLSVVDEASWRQLEAVVSSARKVVDTLIVTAHWGDYGRPFVITEFERNIAMRLTALGVDIIFGHHQHMLRGVEFIEGGIGFYGLGHVLFDHPRYHEELRVMGRDLSGASERDMRRRYGKHGIYPRDGGFPFSDLARWSAAAVVEISGSERRSGLSPLHISLAGDVTSLKRGGKLWGDWIAFFRECLNEEVLDTRLEDRDWNLNGIPVLDLVEDHRGARDGAVAR